MGQRGKGFPASSTVFIGQNQLYGKSVHQRLSTPDSQASLGDIQFIKPANGSTVQPGAKVDVELSLTGTLTLKNMMITATGSDMVEIVNPPYTTTLTVPGDSYGSFDIFVLGEGTDGNLYSASVSLSVNNAAVLEKVDVSPQSIYLNLGQEMDISVTGTYSDGSIRSLSAGAQGTTYKSSHENIVSISENGKVTPHTVGTGFILVSPSLSEPVTVKIEIVSTYVGAQLVVTPNAHKPSSSSGTIAFNVSNTGMEVMPWTAAVTAGGSWLRIVSGSSGMDAGTITCAFDANTSTSARTGTIRVTASGAAGSPVDVTVTQAATAAKPVISGTVKTGAGAAIPGVTITFSNSGGTATTDASGNYSISVPSNYSGTATPSRTGYTFTPASKTYTNITANQTGQNYTGTVQTTSRQQFWGVWSDGVYAWDKTTGKWTKMASTSNATMIAAGKVDTDAVDDLIGVWTSGLYVKLSTNGQWLKLATTLPTWIAAGDLNNDGRDDVIASWKNDSVYYRDSATGKWFKLSTAAKQLAAGNIGGTRDDLAGVWSDGLWVRYSADASWKKIDPGIPLWITVGDMTGDKRADIVGSYSTGTWYRNSVTAAWTKISTPAEQLTTGDLDGDGRDDLIGVWSNGVYVRYGATSQWQLITPSKPKWITTGRMTEALQSAGSLDDPQESTDENGMIDLTREGPDGMMADRHFLDGEGPMPAE